MEIAQKIGVLGGGQLGRMLIEASIPLGLDISILDESIDYPAAQICSSFFKGNFTNFEDVYDFGLNMDIITLEIESVNVEALQRLEQIGKKVYPQPRILHLINDKGLQKMFYRDNNLPSSKFQLVESKDHLLEMITKGEITLPFVQKLRKGGYDGRGVRMISTTEDLIHAFDAPCVIEEKVNIAKEMAIIVARNPSGDLISYPMVDMQFDPDANLVEMLYSPSELSKEQQLKADTIAINLAKQLDIVGLLAIEFFLDTDGNILINEVAPRPHNSGHHTIEACTTSQFEQLIRCILDIKLGSTELLIPAVMVNLLGSEGHTGTADYLGLKEVLAMEGVFPHLYGKKTTKPKRKMGHVTVINHDLNKAKESARTCLEKLKIVSKPLSITS